MPLETATYIPDLVTSNPAHSDGLNNADAHLRLIKAALKATFPNFTDAALASTQAALDAAVATVNTNGVSVLADAGVNFKTNNTDGLRNPAAGEVDIDCAGVAQLKVTSAGIQVPGTVAATGGHTGPGATPIGAMIMWLTDTLPSGSGVWAWANGQAISRTTYATLFGLPGWGTTYGVGDGTTTFNLPNYQEVTLVGKSTMGGAASPGLLSSIASGIKTVLGSLFGTDTTTLSTANLPAYTPSGTIAVAGTTNILTAPTQAAMGSGGNTVYGTSGANNSQNLSLNVSSQTFTGGAQGGSSQAFGNLPPSRTVNFIIRIA